MHIVTVLGARPQFIKAAPVCTAFQKAGIRETVIHTGQHYDEAMSDIFFRQMSIPEPAYNLGVGSASHGRQTAAMLVGIEEVLLQEQPDMLLIYGDTNSTVAGALAACKLHIPIAHVEAGLRSFNKTMPEEHNRIMTDHVSSLLFCPVRTAVEQLHKEGLSDGIHFVGDTMYDAVLQFLPIAINAYSHLLQEFEVQEKEFFIATIHRPYNTDKAERLQLIFEAFERCGRSILFPIHPRTRAKIGEFRVRVPSNVRLIEPLGYLQMLFLQQAASLILTDSGGVQKEACFVKTPAVTIRSETEWRETIEAGWNVLAFDTADDIEQAIGKQMQVQPLPLTHYGKGEAAHKITKIITQFL